MSENSDNNKDFNINGKKKIEYSEENEKNVCKSQDVQTFSIKKILSEKILELEDILADDDKSDDLLISYMLINENHRLNEKLNFEDVWTLIKKISESWNTLDLLGFECPISKEEFKLIWLEVLRNNERFIDDIDNFKFDEERMDLNSIKPIIKIIFESIIFGYKKIIETFD